MQLRLVSYMEDNIDEFYSCQSPEEIKAHNKLLAPPKAAIQDLSANAKDSIKEFNSARRSATKSMEAASVVARPQPAASVVETGKPGDGSQLFDLCAAAAAEEGFGASISTVTAPDGDDLDSSKALASELHGDGSQPFVMHLPLTAGVLAISEENKFTCSLAFFMPEFMQLLA